MSRLLIDNELTKILCFVVSFKNTYVNHTLDINFEWNYISLITLKLPTFSIYFFN